MFDRLRRPLFLIAAIVLLVTVVIEAGSTLLKPAFNEGVMRTQTRRSLKKSDLSDDERSQMERDMVSQARQGEKPPGMGIPYMALLDGLVLFAVLLIGDSLILPGALHGRLQGIVTLVVSLLVLLAAVGLFFKAFVQLLIMLALFFAPPFGTLAYLAKWGFFDRGGAAAILGVAMMLKLVFAVLLVLAQQRFLQNKGLVLIIITTLICNLVVSFLHGLVPVILVSITDAVAAIIAVILAAIWAILMLIGSVISVVKAVA